MADVLGLIECERGLKKYSVTLADLRRLKVTIYTEDRGMYQEFTGEVFGSLSGLFVDEDQLARKVEGYRTIKPPAKKPKADTLDIRKPKSKKPWTSYSPSRPTIED